MVSMLFRETLAVNIGPRLTIFKYLTEQEVWREFAPGLVQGHRDVIRCQGSLPLSALPFSEPSHRFMTAAEAPNLKSHITHVKLEELVF